MKSRVFVVERPRRRLDLTTATAFGEVTLVFGDSDRRCSVFSAEAFGDAVLLRLREMKFDPDVDYFCVAGPMVPVCLATAAVLRAYPSVHLLLYNASESTYVPRRVSAATWETTYESD